MTDDARVKRNDIMDWFCQGLNKNLDGLYTLGEVGQELEIKITYNDKSKLTLYVRAVDDNE